MIWFTETAWPPMLVCGVVAIVFGILWHERRRASLLLGVIIALLGGGAIWVIEHQIVTERERVIGLVEEITSAYQRGDLDRTAAIISNRSPELQTIATATSRMFEVKDDMRLTDLHVDMLANETRAKSRFRVNATVTVRASEYTQHQATRWEASWQLEGGDWKMYDLVEIDPITGERRVRLRSWGLVIRRMSGS